MPRIRITTLRWFNGILGTLIGTIMLVLPHQFASPTYALLRPHIMIWGAAVLTAGVGLLVLIITRPTRRAEIAVHGIAGAIMLLAAYGFAAARSWPGAANFAVLGIATILAPFLARGNNEGPPVPELDLWVVAVGMATLLDGLSLLVAPGQITTPISSDTRSHVAWLGGAMLAGGLAVVAAQSRKGILSRWAYWVAHLAAGGVLFAYMLTFSFVLKVLIEIAYYGGAGAVLLLFPWLETRLANVNSRSLQTQLALALSLAVSLPLVLTVVLQDALLGPTLSAAGVGVDQAVRDLSFAIVLAVAVLAGLAGLLVARWLAAPLNAITRAVTSLAAGDTAVPLPEGGSAETIRLASAFADMRDQLNERTADRERLLEEAERRTSELGALQRVTDPALGRQGLDELVHSLLERTVAIMRADTGALMLLDPASQELVLKATVGMPVEQVIGARLPVGTDFAGRVAARNQVVWVRDAQQDPVFASPAIRASNIRAMLGAPLRVREDLAGVIFVGFTRAREFGSFEERLLSVVAERAALAINQARLLEQSVELQGRTARALGQAEDALRTRDEFLGVAAHELKTPVTSLRGFAEVSLRRMDTGRIQAPPEIHRTLQAIDSQAERLSILANQLLDLTALESGQLVLHREPTDLVPLVRRLVRALQLTTTRHDLELHAPATLTAYVDPERLRLVLYNLIDNAIKYSPAGGPVEVELAAPDAGTVRISVRDYGPGIPLEQRPHLFTRFFKAEAVRPAGGLGLGLYIGQGLVALHGGTLAAEFPPDGGSRFVVTLPMDMDASTHNGEPERSRARAMA